jgi:glyoxylate reductase
MATPNKALRNRAMTQNRPQVIVTRRLPDVIETRMMELFDARLNLDDQPMTQAELLQAVEEADVLVPTVTDRIDAGVLSHAGAKLKLIASFGTGVDHIDLKTARQRGINVTNTPGVLTEDTADMTMALILAVPRRLAEGERLVRSHRHGPHRPGGGPPGQGLRPVGPLPQPAPGASRHRG